MIPVVCFTCGGPLDHEVVFMRLRRERLAEARAEFDVAPGREMCVKGFTAELGSVLDALGISNICCRTHMLSAVTAETA